MEKQWIDEVQKLHDADEHDKIVELINSLEEPDYEAIGYRARAYNNLGMPKQALQDLYSIEEQGREDKVWNYRVMYSCSELFDPPKTIEHGLKAFGITDETDQDIAVFMAYAYFAMDMTKEGIDLLLQYPNEEDPFWNELTGQACFLDKKFEEAKGYFEKGLSLVRGQESLIELENVILKELLRVLEYMQAQDDIKKLTENYPQLLDMIHHYSDEDYARVRQHLERYLGESELFYHEMATDDIRLDIVLFRPTAQRDHYVLSTIGMGAMKMEAVPQELQQKGIGRAEIMVALPSDWELDSEEECWYWPLRWMKLLARFPFREETWLGEGHTIPNGEPFAENTKLSTILLDRPYDYSQELFAVELSEGEKVHFLQMTALYLEESQYKMEHGVRALYQLFDSSFQSIVQIKRKNYALGKRNKGGEWKNSPF